MSCFYFQGHKYFKKVLERKNLMMITMRHGWLVVLTFHESPTGSGTINNSVEKK